MRKLILLIMIFSLIGCSSKKNTVMAPETSPEPIQNEAAQNITHVQQDEKEEEFEQQNSQPPKTSIKSENKQNSNTNNKQSAAGEETRHQLKQEVVETAQQEKSQTVQLKITADKQILDVAVEIKEGETVFDLLKRVTKEKGIQMKSRGFGAFVYVESIGNLREFDKGPTSGWIYYVNGEFQQKGAGQVKIKAGDIIEWKYEK